MIRVLHLIATLDVGGVEQQLVELIGQEANDIEHVVVCLTRGGPLQKELQREGVSVEILGKVGPYDVRVLPKILRAIRNNQPDILHTYMFTANFWGRLAALFFPGLEVVSGVRCLDPSEMQGIYLWSDRLLALRSSLMIGVSHAIDLYLERRVGVPRARRRVVWNGKDPARYPPDVGRASMRERLGIDGEQKLVGLVGRLHWQKGPDVLVDAALRVIQKDPSVRFLLVGEGPEENRLRKQIRDRSLEGSVKLFGRCDEMPPLYAALDLVVLPSRYEGLPNVAVEAMASNRPVVATDIAGTREVVVDGETGLLVNVGDSEGLAKAILRLVLDPAESLRLAKNGRIRFLEFFTASRSAGKVLDIYRELAGATTAK